MPATQPKAMTTPWGKNGLKNEIPEKRTPTSTYGSASYDTGFPSETMTPIASGGKPPSGKDMNGVLFDLSEHIVYQSAGNRYRFDAEWVQKTGGYAKGAVVMNDAGDTEYVSLVDNNTSNPNTEDRSGKWAIHAGNKLAQLAEQAGRKAVPIGAIFAFDKRVTEIEDWLICDGAKFNTTTYPDLYKALGNKDVLPQIPLSNIGMTAFFPTDEVPKGWIYFDDIHSKVTEQAYPKLYAFLVKKYGSIANVPTVEDRFIRNASNGLNVGLKQVDSAPNHYHGVGQDTGQDNDDIFVIKRGWSNPTPFTHYITYGDWNTQRRHANIQFSSGSLGTTNQIIEGGENRPKSLVQKLCIKAVDDFADVVFWIKAKNKAETSLDNSGVVNGGGSVVLSGDYEIQPTYKNILLNEATFATGQNTVSDALKTPLPECLFVAEWSHGGNQFSSTHFAQVGRTQDFNVAISPNAEPNQLNFVVNNRDISLNNTSNQEIKLLSLKILSGKVLFPEKPKATDDDPEVAVLLQAKADLQKSWQERLLEIRTEKAVIVDAKERDLALVTSHPFNITYSNSSIFSFYIPVSKNSLFPKNSVGLRKYDGKANLLNDDGNFIVKIDSKYTEEEAKNALNTGNKVDVFAFFMSNGFLTNGAYNNAKTVTEAAINKINDEYKPLISRLELQENELDSAMTSQIMRIDAQIQKLKNGE